MLSYYEIYQLGTTSSSGQSPAGIIVMDGKTGDAIRWIRLIKDWVYDPTGIVRFLDEPMNWDRIEPIDRAAAERLTLEITERDGVRQDLPSEEEIRAMFAAWTAPPESPPDPAVFLPPIQAPATGRYAPQPSRLSYLLVHDAHQDSINRSIGQVSGPRGIIIRDPVTGDALVWNQQVMGWRYDPRLANDIMASELLKLTFEVVDRGTAERLLPEATGQRMPLPDEETIYRIFHDNNPTPAPN
jgi:hypothetical protein